MDSKAPKRRKRVIFTFPPPMMADLEHVSALTGRAISELVREFVALGLKEEIMLHLQRQGALELLKDIEGAKELRDRLRRDEAGTVEAVGEPLDFDETDHASGHAIGFNTHGGQEEAQGYDVSASIQANKNNGPIVHEKISMDDIRLDAFDRPPLFGDWAVYEHTVLYGHEGPSL